MSQIQTGKLGEWNRNAPLDNFTCVWSLAGIHICSPAPKMLVGWFKEKRANNKVGAGWFDENTIVLQSKGDSVEALILNVAR